MKFIGVIAVLSFLVAGSVSAHAADLGLDCPENNTTTSSPPQMLNKNVTPYTYTPVPKPPPKATVVAVPSSAPPVKVVHDDETAFVTTGDHSGSMAYPTVTCDTVLVVPFTTTAGVNSVGRLVALTANQKKFQMSVSTTPGNFAVPAHCYGSGSAGLDTIYYSPTGVFLSEETPACTVLPGQQYYYNLRMTLSCEAAKESSAGGAGLFQTTRYVDIP